MLRLSDLVATSARVAATRARREKVAHLAGLLSRLEPAEVPIAVAFLSGDLRQGRVGLGPAAVRGAWLESPAAEPTLGLGEVDAAFERIAAAAGRGATGEKAALLAALLARATAAEGDFLTRLVLGELRQ